MRKRLCKIFGCGKEAIDEKGFCSKHRWPDRTKEEIAEYRKRYGSTTERGYNYKWQQFRKRLIANHPYCERCGSNDNLVLDHKDIPAQIMMDVYGQFILEDHYYQVLCTRCNTIKAKEDKLKIETYFKNKGIAI